MKIAVFCASANKISSLYFTETTRLGQLIAERGDTLVYGGTNCGLMKCCADAVLSGHGRTIGIIPECIQARGVQALDCSELIVTPDMKSRKEQLREQSDAFIALPGGWGTIEEISEVITLKQLGMHNKPIVFLNIDGYYNLFFEFLASSSQKGFISSAYDNLYVVVNSVDEALTYLHNYSFSEPYLNKYNEISK